MYIKNLTPDEFENAPLCVKYVHMAIMIDSFVNGIMLDKCIKDHPEYFTRPPFTPDQPLRALSWKQPYAELMFHGKMETRTWNTKYRGWVLICTSKTPYSLNKIFGISGTHQYFRMVQCNLDTQNYNGKAIAIGRLVDCRIMDPDDEDKCFVRYRTGLYCHIYEDVTPIEPFPWKGSQGWKEVPTEIKNQIKIISDVSSKAI